MADSWLMTADFLAASPSRKDGISAAAEADLKRKTCKLMLAAAHELALESGSFGLRQISTKQESTGVYEKRPLRRVLFFHAPACLITTTTTVCRCRFSILYKHVSVYLLRLRAGLQTLQLLICERAVMQTLGFYLTVDHVHMRLKDAVKQLCEGRTAGSRGSDVTAKSGTSKP
eukprot:18740-Heterococcus_DN1.PRE.1